MRTDTTRIVAELMFDARCELGEGPAWFARDEALVWVDILGQVVHRLVPRTMVHATQAAGQPVGAVVPRVVPGYAMAIRHGFALVDAWGAEPRAVATIEPADPTTRMNDGKCDVRGRFWAGTAVEGDAARGALYRLDPASQGDHPATILSGVRCSNGLCWDADGRSMYYIDTPRGGVDRFDFDLDAGIPSNRRRAFEVEGALPDGMTIDAEGCLWVALWGGHRVHRYTPNGRLDRVVEIPVAQVTSCTFGGADLGDLFITTARAWRSQEELTSEPHAGSVFVCRPGVKGTPTCAFGA